MKEIRNFKGEIVQRKAAYGDRWWHFSKEFWGIFGGVLFLLIGHLVPDRTILNIYRFLDIRLWTWQHILLISSLIGYTICFTMIVRNWKYYDKDEESHAKYFVGFCTTMLVMVIFFVSLSLTDRFCLFFRPITDMLTRGIFSLSAIWRAIPVISLSLFLIYFGTEWILGIWDN